MCLVQWPRAVMARPKYTSRLCTHAPARPRARVKIQPREKRVNTMQAWESRIYAENDFDDTKASEEGEENVLHALYVAYIMEKGPRRARERAISMTMPRGAKKRLYFFTPLACTSERSGFSRLHAFVFFSEMEREREREPGLFGRLLGGYELVMIESWRFVLLGCRGPLLTWRSMPLVLLIHKHVQTKIKCRYMTYEDLERERYGQFLAAHLKQKERQVLLKYVYTSNKMLNEIYTKLLIYRISNLLLKL